MAVIETWFNQDLQKPVKTQYIDGSLFSNNGNGNRIGVVVTDNGEPVTISGTVSGYVVVSDGSTVPCTGAKSGNRASILIPPAAYVPGSAFISLFIMDGTTVTTLAAVSTTVLQTRTGTQVDPGSVVTDWTQTINGAMQDVQTAAANLGSIVATPYASLTYPVPLGKYTYYDGGLYRCISPIASSETFTPAHWTAVKLGDDVSDLKTALYNSTLKIEEQFSIGNYIDALGALASGSNFGMTVFHVNKGEKIYYSAKGYNSVSILAYNDSADASSGWIRAVASSGDSVVSGAWVAVKDCYVAVSSHKSYTPKIEISTEYPLLNNAENNDIVLLSMNDASSIEIPNSSWNYGYYIGTDGEKNSSNNFKYSNPISVNSGDIVCFYGKGYSTQVSVITSCNSSGGSRSCLVASTDDSDKVYYYTVPANGYIIVCTNIKNPGVLKILGAKSNQALAEKASDLQHEFDLLGTTDYTKNISWVAGKYIDANGTDQTASSFKRSTPIAVSKGTLIIFSGTGYNTAVSMIATCDQNGNNITPAIKSLDSTHRSYRYKATANTYIIVSTNKNDANVSLLLCSEIANESLWQTLVDNDIGEENPLLQNQTTRNYITIFHKMGVVGDSLASGVFNTSNGEITDMTYSWIQIIARLMGITGVNFSQGGLTTRSALSLFVNPASFAENLCDCYIIALGVNDRYYQSISDPKGVPLGTTSDINLSDRTQNADTYYGNYASIIQRIKEVQPKAKIFCVTNPVEVSETSGYNNSVRYMPTIFDNVYLIDLYTYGLDIYTEFRNAGGPYWYGSHSTALGYSVAARHIMSYMDWIIKNNMMNFKDTQFIGTDYHY